MASCATAPSAFGPSASITVRRLAVGLALASAALSANASNDLREARSLAATCANCHGTDGRAQGAMTVLAGYPADRLVAMLQDFRSGKRPATIMHQIAKGYTEAQISTIARYFAAQKAN